MIEKEPKKMPLKMNLQYFSNSGTEDDFEQFGDAFVDDNDLGEPPTDLSTTNEEQNSEELEEGQLEQEGQEEQSLEEFLLEIKYNGEPQKLTKEQAAELASKGYDYTQKTQALKERERELDDLVQFSNGLQQNPEFAEYLARAIQDFYSQGQGNSNKQEPTNQPSQYDISRDPRFVQLQRQLEEIQNHFGQQQYNTEFERLSEKYPDAKNQRGQIDELIQQKPGLNFEDAYFLLNRENLIKQQQEDLARKSMMKKSARTQTKQQTSSNRGVESSGDDILDAFLNSKDLFMD